MQKRIFWTDAERDTVMARALGYLQSGTFSELDSLRQAQRFTLSPDRHRTFASYSAAKPEIKALKAMAIAAIQRKREVESPIIVIPQPPVPPDPQPSMPTGSIDELVATIAQLIASQLATAIKSAVQTTVQELEHTYSLPRHDPTYEIDHEQKKRVIVIGLLNDQAHAITREFGEAFNIKCIDTDRAMGMSPPDADAYLLMKNFINHPLYHKYQAFPNHVLIDGGMSTLRMWFNTKGKEL
jgi:hypothetical protein